MDNFIFKSPRRLIKNSPTTSGIVMSNIMSQIKIIQSQNRLLRQDLVDVKLMINKLLIDKHNQMEVDDFFERQDGH